MCGVLARAHRASSIAVIPMVLLLAGCGSTSFLAVTSTRPGHRAAAAKRAGAPSKVTAPPTPVPPFPELGGPLPAPGPTGIHPAAAAVAVIRAWSDALRRGDVRGAARYFAVPSVMINGTDSAGSALVIAIDTRTEARAANASLPCGAKLISADQRGRYVNALFRLTSRPGPGGSACGTGAGQTARTNFLIVGGLIVEWIRAPDDPGDNGGSTAPEPAPVNPTLPPSEPTV
jgi:hypothetical protein